MDSHRTALILFAVALAIAIVVASVTTLERQGKRWSSDEPRSSPVGSMSLYIQGADATFSFGIGLQGGGPL